jgi:nicotinate phosphoribosyltransferase
MSILAREAVAASPLLTDLYELTMLDAYYRLGMEKPAVFEFFVRRLPQARNFLIAAGLEQVLDYLENLRFGAEEIEWLASMQRFSPEFLAPARFPFLRRGLRDA